MNSYYKRKIQKLPQNRSAFDDLPVPGDRRHAVRPRLAVLTDQRGWAYHDQALQKTRNLADGWDIEIFFLNEKPFIDPHRFDLLYNFNHTPSKYDELFHHRLIKGLYSHYHHTANIPWQYVYRVVKHASVLVVANREQQQEISPYFRNTVELPDSIDTDLFFLERQRTGNDIIAGWSGNPDRRLARKRVKRFYEVVEPACAAAGTELRKAVNLDREALRKMYNEVDVVLIASITEGNPISLFEAGACGRTVIATTVGVIPQVVRDGEEGFLIDASLPDKEIARLMTDRLLWCKKHPAETRSMGLKLRERILKERTAEVAGNVFRDLAEKVLMHYGNHV